MPAVALQGQMSTGHGCFPPTAAVGPYTTKSYFNGKPIQLRGTTQYAPHTCGTTTHPSSARKVSAAGGTFYLEGKLVAMIGDMIDCGDAVAEGSPTSFIA